ncbi:MAG: hypothetical protein IJO62_02305 [Clostridia bacterium]|nr:hypothetical protein [Clostridia bacterium]
MTFLQGLTTLFEIGMAVALFWCFFNEDKLIAFERKLFAILRRKKLKVVHTSYSTANTVRQ